MWGAGFSEAAATDRTAIGRDVREQDSVERRLLSPVQAPELQVLQ